MTSNHEPGTDSRPTAPLCRRGDIFYIMNTTYAETGDPKAGRPGVIVSSDHTNATEDYVMVVYMTTHDTRPAPTHISMEGAVPSVLLCERIYSIRKDRIGQFMRHCSDGEMQRVNLALIHSLGIPSTVQAPPVINTDTEAAALRQDVAFYKRMNEELLARMTGREVPRGTEG